MESIIYVGIDVHKDTYSLCSFDMQKDLFFSQHTMKASTAKVASYLKKISESNGNAITVCGYEAAQPDTGCALTFSSRDSTA